MNGWGPISHSLEVEVKVEVGVEVGVEVEGKHKLVPRNTPVSLSSEPRRYFY